MTFSVRPALHRYLNAKGFDAADEVAKKLVSYAYREGLCLRLARRSKDPSGVGSLIRAANECARLATDLESTPQ